MTKQKTKSEKAKLGQLFLNKQALKIASATTDFLNAKSSEDEMEAFGKIVAMRSVVNDLALLGQKHFKMSVAVNIKEVR